MECGINLKKLQEDFHKKLSEEIRYKKQDEVRFQTLGDPRITYDQYSELLKGAHLVPLKSEQTAEIKKHYKQEIHYSDFDDIEQSSSEHPHQQENESDLETTSIGTHKIR